MFKVSPTELKDVCVHYFPHLYGIRMKRFLWRGRIYLGSWLLEPPLGEMGGKGTAGVETRVNQERETWVRNDVPPTRLLVIYLVLQFGSTF